MLGRLTGAIQNVSIIAHPSDTQKVFIRLPPSPSARNCRMAVTLAHFLLGIRIRMAKLVLADVLHWFRENHQCKNK